VSSPRIAILGAGLAGVAAARTLQAAGHAPVLFEKSRGLGGRCATKRWMDCPIDHGAQYFTLRDHHLRSLVFDTCGHALRLIHAPIVSPSGDPLPADERFFHAAGNSRLARDLAGGLDIRLETPVSSLAPAGSVWLVNGQPFDHVIATAPLPQTLALLGLPLPADPFIPCLALILRFHGDPSSLAAARYAVSDPHSPILSWSACENHKPGRIPSGSTIMVAHAAEAFSRHYLDSSPDTWSRLLLTEVARLWDIPPGSLLAQLPHRWRYARVASPITPPHLPPGIHLASDALIASRVESALLSGITTATRLLGTL
jgi:renalase